MTDKSMDKNIKQFKSILSRLLKLQLHKLASQRDSN